MNLAELPPNVRIAAAIMAAAQSRRSISRRQWSGIAKDAANVARIETWFRQDRFRVLVSVPDRSVECAHEL